MSIFNITFFFGGNIEKLPFTYWLSGRWFLQIVDRDSGNIYQIYPLFSYSDLLCQLWGGGGRNVFLAFYLVYFDKHVMDDNTSCTNVTLFNVIHFQFTGQKLAYLRVTGTLYLAQLIHVFQNDLHSNNILGWMILCFHMYIYNKITL